MKIDTNIAKPERATANAEARKMVRVWAVGDSVFVPTRIDRDRVRAAARAARQRVTSAAVNKGFRIWRLA